MILRLSPQAGFRNWLGECHRSVNVTIRSLGSWLHLTRSRWAQLTCSSRIEIQRSPFAGLQVTQPANGPSFTVEADERASNPAMGAMLTKRSTTYFHARSGLIESWPRKQWPSL